MDARNINENSHLKPMNDLIKIEKRVEREELLRTYEGTDRVVHAEEKKAELESLRANRPVFQAKTGIPMLDECVDGFRKGQLVIVSGPTKHGKTSLAQTLTKRFVEQGHQTLWFSYELGYEELFEKFPMEKLDFYVPNYLENGNVQWIEDKIIESRMKHGTDIVFIDHLDFLRDLDVLKGVGLNLSAYIGGIVQKIKRVAVEQNVLIFLMSHIRKNNWSGKELPTAEELRDSGQIAQLADIVLMVMREKNAGNSPDELYNGTNAWIGIMANRHNGRTKRIPVTFGKSADSEKGYAEFRERIEIAGTPDTKSLHDWL